MLQRVNWTTGTDILEMRIS